MIYAAALIAAAILFFVWRASRDDPPTPLYEVPVIPPVQMNEPEPIVSHEAPEPEPVNSNAHIDVIEEPEHIEVIEPDIAEPVMPIDPETVFRAWLEYTYPAQAKLTHTLRSPWADEQVRNGVKPATKLEPWARLAGLGEYGTHLSATPGNYTIISDWSAAVIQAQGPDSEWAWPGIALSRSYWPGYAALINALRHPDWPARINALMG